MIELKNNTGGLNYRQALKGDKGDNGASAFEIAVANGFKGTETEWLASLKGKDGAKGEKGDTGATGKEGARGADGAKGDKGDKGDTGAPFTYDMFTSEQLSALKGDKGEKGEKGDTGEAGASKPTLKSMIFEGNWDNFALNATIQDADKELYKIDVLIFDWVETMNDLFDSKLVVGVTFLVNNTEYSFFEWFTDANNNVYMRPQWDFMNSGFIVARLTNCSGGRAENIFNNNHEVTAVKVYYIEVNE